MVVINMEVFHLHRETNRALCKLPEDITPLIQDFICPTRRDWRKCRTHEANLIKRLQEVVTKSLVEPDVNDWIFDEFTVRELNTWTLHGVLYIIAWLNQGGVYQYGRPPRCRPKYNDNYCKWYTQTFMWCAYS